MNGINKIVIFGVLIFGSWNCTKKMNAEQFVEICNKKDGPYCMSICRDRMDFHLYYRPLEFFMAKARTNNSNMDDDQAALMYKDSHTFLLNIEGKNGFNVGRQLFFSNVSTRDDITRNAQIMYDFKEKATLIQNADTVKCMQSVIDRSWGMHDNITVLMQFPATNSKKQEYDLDSYYLNLLDFGLMSGTLKFELNDLCNNTVALKEF